MLSILNTCVLESYTRELYCFRKGDGIFSNTDGADCLFHGPGEHDNFCFYVQSLGICSSEVINSPKYSYLYIRK